MAHAVHTLGPTVFMNVSSLSIHVGTFEQIVAPGLPER